jgi:hypothetical protein
MGGKRLHAVRDHQWRIFAVEETGAQAIALPAGNLLFIDIVADGVLDGLISRLGVAVISVDPVLEFKDQGIPDLRKPGR